MNVASLQTLVIDLTNTNSTTFSDADTLRLLNIAYGHRILDILRLMVDKNASIQKATTNLISTVGLVEGDNGYNGEYAFPTDLLRPVRFEVSYDGTSWKKAEIYDNPENTGTEFNQAEISNHFSMANLRVDFNRDSFMLRPLKTTAGDITNGIYIEYEQRQTDLTSGSPNFETNLHDILAYDVAETEFIKHSESHTVFQYQRFQISKGQVEIKFMDYYKNKFKRTLRMKPNISSYK